MTPLEPTATTQKAAVGGPRRPAVEIPTLLLILATYAAWGALTLAYGRWPLYVLAPLIALVLTLHSSIQHEIVHGHPTRWRALNRLFAVVPLTLWLPYERYRHTHHVHHIDARLTDPLDDPESFYWRAEDWARLGPVARRAHQLQQTLAGRILLGSFWRIGMFLRDELLALRHSEQRPLIRNKQNVRRVWLEHLAWCVPVVLWLHYVCAMPLWIYFVATVVPANGILLIRSFAEHRARQGVRERVAVVEDSWLLGPLFLFNNLHSLHHESPAIPWYSLPRRYRLERERLLADNGGLVYRTYFEVAWRYLFRAHDVTTHPTDRVPAPAA
ncbi:MAG TPA: fatty acid desaturase [Steroidobacteraceae bacterium]|nr:fatty acid desaturase [Steroidobacteraceae bacterium]